MILSLTKMHESGMSLLREASELRMASGTDPETLRREVVGADGLIIRTGGIVDAALMDRGKDLKVVGRHGVGYDAIDVDAATERGIQVVYTPGANTQSVAEHVFAMMIGLSKHFTADEGRGRGLRLPRPDEVHRPRPLRADARHHRLRPDRPARRRDRPGRPSR